MRMPTPGQLSLVAPPSLPGCLPATPPVLPAEDQRVVVKNTPPLVAEDQGMAAGMGLLPAVIPVTPDRKPPICLDSPIIIDNSPASTPVVPASVSPAFTALSTPTLSVLLSSSPSILGSPSLPPVTSPRAWPRPCVGWPFSSDAWATSAQSQPVGRIRPSDAICNPAVLHWGTKMSSYCLYCDGWCTIWGASGVGGEATGHWSPARFLGCGESRSIASISQRGGRGDPAPMPKVGRDTAEVPTVGKPGGVAPVLWVPWLQRWWATWNWYAPHMLFYYSQIVVRRPCTISPRGTYNC